MVSRKARAEQHQPTRRIEFAGSVHDEREIEAVVQVLRGGATSLRIGKNVRAMEERVARLFAKRRGVMCNSGSSALYLALEVLDLQPGDEVVTSAVTFSTDIAPMVRKGVVPAFVDVTSDTFQIDVDGIEAMIAPRTKAILAPNLIGNAPDWDVIRAIADAHHLVVIEDSCDALGLTLRGTPTGARADISLTSFALSHIITAAGTGGMVCFDDEALADKALLFRRWGRRSELQLFGSQRGAGNRFFSALEDGLEYDNLFIFDESGWNFEPSELSAAFGLVQLDKLETNLARRKRNFEVTSSYVAAWPHLFTLPRLTEGIETGWHMYPILINPASGIVRAELQQWMERNGVDTRMVWTGNITRQPMLRSKDFRVPTGGLPHADSVMEQGLILPNSHSLSDDDCHYIGTCLAGFVEHAGLAPSPR